MSVFNDTSHQSGSVPLSGGGMSENKKFSYGYSSLRGKRASMEDFHDAKIHKIEDKMVGLFGVFDGHGGSRAADYVQQNLFKNLLEHPQFVTDTKLAIAETYQSTDQAYLQAENNQHRDAGSTASTAVLVEDRLYVANVGDSRAVVCIGGIGHMGRAFPTFPTFSSCLPSPDPELFKEYSVTGHGGLMCGELSKRKLLPVFNPLTGETRAVLPLLHPRTPVLSSARTSFILYDMRNGELLVKTSGQYGDSPAADYAKQVPSTILRLLGAMSIPPKILAFGVLCNLLQPANAQQVTGSSNPVDPAAWLTIDTAKVAFVTALFAGGLGAAFIWKRFFSSPPTFTVANINAGLEATPPRVRREDLDSIYPLITDWASS